jgi:hypothetical protein
LGNAIWAKSQGSLSSDRGYGASSDNFGNVYITGYYKSDTVNFGSNKVSSDGSSQMFLAKVQNPNTISFVKHPASKTMCLENTVKFEVSVSGQEPISYQWQYNGTDITVNGDAKVYTLSSAVYNDSGYYRCIVSNVYGKISSSDAYLTVDQKLETPVISQVGDDQLECSVSGTYYQWFRNDTLINDSTKIITPGISGTYKVIVFVNESYSDTSDGFQFIISGINPFTNPDISKVLLYPNPVKDKVFISLKGQNISGLNLSILNLNGEVQQKINNLNSKELDFSTLSNGIYIIEIVTPDFVQIKKLMKE